MGHTRINLGLIGLGRLGVMSDIKYYYLKWKMNRLRKRFNVHSGRGGPWDDRIH